MKSSISTSSISLRAFHQDSKRLMAAVRRDELLHLSQLRIIWKDLVGVSEVLAMFEGLGRVFEHAAGDHFTVNRFRLIWSIVWHLREGSELSELVGVLLLFACSFLLGLHSDKVITAGKGSNGVSFAMNMEKDLDGLIEENIRLQNEEDELMDKVRKK